MASQKLVGELISFYYELDDIIVSMAGNVDIAYITDLKDLQIRLDKQLTNLSKRWAQGNHSRGYIPVKYIRADEEDTAVQVNTNTL